MGEFKSIRNIAIIAHVDHGKTTLLDNMLKQSGKLITYSLYPVMLFAFLSFMFIACDKIYFKDLHFEKEEITLLNNKKQWFKLKDGECNKNETTLACMIQNYNFKKSSILGLFDFTYMEFSSSLIGELLKLAIVLFLFYHFLNILPNIVDSGNVKLQVTRKEFEYIKKNNKNKDKDGKVAEGEYRIDFANSEGKECYVIVTSEKSQEVGNTLLLDISSLSMKSDEGKYVAQTEMSKILGLDKAGAKEFNTYLNSVIVGQAVEQEQTK